MPTSLIHLPQLAKQKEDENWRFRQYLKTQSRITDEQLDQLVSDITRRVWSGVDCTTCANCCKTVRPTFDETDIARLARRLAIDPKEFIDRYLEPVGEDGETSWQTRSTPCPFLENNRCSVYEDRPADCRGYPYLYEPDFSFRTMGMIERTHTCPIVYEVLEELKNSLHFTRQRRS